MSLYTAIMDVLLKSYISFPKGDQIKQVVDGFQRTWGVSQCCGAIDGCHIPISAPAMNHNNRKGFYTIFNNNSGCSGLSV